jgi:hypothetical protein
MLLAFLALAALPNWVPARWNSGDPRSLDFLAQTPVNCILLESSNWNAEVVKKATGRGIATLGVLHAGTDLASLAPRAAMLHMNGVVLEGDFEAAATDRVRSALADSGLTVIELPVRRHIRLDSGDAIIGTSEGLWPGIHIEHGGSVRSGPTSNPWIDTNTGFLRFLRAANDAAQWIGVRPPPKRAVSVDQYGVVMADAAMSGARWIVSLDDDLDRRLLAGEPQAIGDWKKIAAYLGYFENRKGWRDYKPYSKFAVVQDTESGGLLSASLLDMLSVQHTAVRPVLTRRLDKESLHGARVVLNVDAESITADQKAALQEFVASGGVLVNPPRGWRFPQTSEKRLTPDRRQMNQIQGLWEVAYTATVRKNFGARTFNTSSVLYNLLATADAKGLLIHLVNYADVPAEAIAVQVLGEWKHARLYRPGVRPEDLPLYPIKDGTGIDIDRIPVFATLKVDQ